ncbi:hypothetical protein BKA62DRAFT_483466 [Auriculariales sp. MPI-PUGE-AT-0066]|nr:hypothetical protein BKA62DRAFT_483466 [Auriculariales sp. MPI-PUGE-AT-0066]
MRSGTTRAIHDIPEWRSAYGWRITRQHGTGRPMKKLLIYSHQLAFVTSQDCHCLPSTTQPPTVIPRLSPTLNPGGVLRLMSPPSPPGLTLPSSDRRHGPPLSPPCRTSPPSPPVSMLRLLLSRDQCTNTSLSLVLRRSPPPCPTVAALSIDSSNSLSKYLSSIIRPSCGGSASSSTSFLEVGALTILRTIAVTPSPVASPFESRSSRSRYSAGVTMSPPARGPPRAVSSTSRYSMVVTASVQREPLQSCSGSYPRSTATKLGSCASRLYAPLLAFSASFPTWSWSVDSAGTPTTTETSANRRARRRITDRRDRKGKSAGGIARRGVGTWAVSARVHHLSNQAAICDSA